MQYFKEHIDYKVLEDKEYADHNSVVIPDEDYEVAHNWGIRYLIYELLNILLFFNKDIDQKIYVQIFYFIFQDSEYILHFIHEDIFYFIFEDLFQSQPPSSLSTCLGLHVGNV